MNEICSASTGWFLRGQPRGMPLVESGTWSLDISKSRETIPPTRSGAAREGKKGFQGKETVGCRSLGATAQ